MWILRYKYELENGSFNLISCPLQNSQKYSIGRSSKNPLNIKNDKSISRQHITITWRGDEHGLDLLNEGKLTAAGGKYLKVGESLTFKGAEHKRTAILIELGTKPIKVEVQWQELIWDIPGQLSNFERTLNNFGVEVELEVIDMNTNLIITTDRKWHRCLFGLVKGLPLMKSQCLTQVCTLLSKNWTDFDQAWSDVLNDKKLMVFPDVIIQERKNIFQGLKFFIIQDDEIVLAYLKTSVEAGGGTLIILNDQQALQRCIESESSVENIIVVQSSQYPINGSAPGYKLHTIENIVDAILSNNINELLGSLVRASQPVPEANHSILNDPTFTESEAKTRDQSGQNSSHNKSEEHDEAIMTKARGDNEDQSKSPKKRRRLNRRVQPLDSLMFFAGGDSPMVDQAAQTQIPAVSAEKSDSLTVRDYEPKHKRNIPADVKELEPEPKRQKGTEVSNMLRIQEKFENTEDVISSPGTSNSCGKEETSSKIAADGEPMDPASRPTIRKKTLGDYDDKVPQPVNIESSPEDLIQVIQDTKNREVKRLRSTLVQVDLNELTDDAINRLGNIAIVENNDSLIRRGHHDAVVTRNDHNLDWNGRKNFKNFVKVRPKYKQQQLGDNFREGSSDFIRNSAFLIARNYVPLKAYSAESAKQQVNNDLYEFPNSARSENSSLTQKSQQGNEEDDADDADEHSFNFTRNVSSSGAGNGLFVVDEDDSQNMEQLNLSKASNSNVSVELTQGNERSLRRSPRRSNAARETRAANHGNNKKADKYNEDDSDDDDDDDDEPKFKFRRQMK